ncbi:MAG: tripartite tricarboxylate transporter TctB family protein [Synergistaceae bacterium]|nr:tripartite tricarboxylate transporter TctB family protein [Synergistaceae bacterium]
MRPNAWVAVTAIVFGLAYGWQALGLRRAPIGNPMAPVYFPLGLAIAMVFFGVLLFYSEARKGLDLDDKSKRPKFTLRGMKLILITIALCLLYTVTFDRLGFVFSTVIFLFAMLSFINGLARTRMNIVVTLCYSFGMWYIFTHAFQIVLPASPLGIF